MPSNKFMDSNLKDSVQNGTIAESFVDDSVLNILTPMFAVGLFDNNNTNSITA